MAELVYILCGMTSIGCAVLLLRQYRATRGAAFLERGVFFLFAITNVLLFVDLVLLPTVDLSLIRSLITIAGIVMLLAALIWGEH